MDSIRGHNAVVGQQSSHTTTKPDFTETSKVRPVRGDNRLEKLCGSGSVPTLRSTDHVRIRKEWHACRRALGMNLVEFYQCWDEIQDLMYAEQALDL